MNKCTADSLPFLVENLRAFVPILLATVTASIIASAGNLRHYFTIRNLPPQSSATMAEKKRGWMMLAFLVIISLLFYQPPKPGPQELSRFGLISTVCFYYLAGMGTQTITSNFLNYPCRSLHRTSKGHLFKKTIKYHSSLNNGPKLSFGVAKISINQYVVLVFDIAVMMFVIWSESQISTYILITGLLVMSWDALPVPVFGAAALLYATIGIAFIVVKLFGASFGIPKSITDITKIYDPAEFATTDLKIFSRWFFPTLWGGLSIAFASQCLNFDFDNQVGRTGADVASFSRSPLVVEPAPEGEPEMGPGFVIPSHIPGPFTKTYFSASLAGLVLAHVMLITGLSCAGIGPESMLIDAYFLSTVSVALPAQFVVVFTLAVLRGEARKFWKYAWVPTAKSSLLDDVLAGHDEDGQMVLKDKRILK